ncbi:hypothetical protein CcaverHIS002_0109260 [Cutaneotrichosporon cavernicola]|uniref:Major facilitator superfamily (MFS) profile domain-containing protein n=1 Tax=Cutaneotrichosporon cavernicola TaxID=279322 RepID=A0AA48I6X4_9TREE|nr:uncharacterized protein CcaverHIS019_0109180 [Cutaneotrichosporon cavernicola]BEI80397.1 hypothetical protein CcaverHIS002_0109260 [Cutaneotrichosporon cavernicola]BEI88200.1 hypothetical protein CcaverHIS019_0109180 [Cutaneotrichosporon cavernicola]BEI95971.1 hypothetical protein CcaverHIS631_0109200 [Cutaneotrichosporon cavernicola]BEJ03745.1 hypothetical protein CcaverHIS641_0109200 [Cutaneotrichosporon cavernicola]
MSSSKNSSLPDLNEKEVVQAVSAVPEDPRGDAELQRALRKVDFRLIPPLAILYLFSYLDRGSLANASIFGIKQDLGLSPQQYNMLVTVFFFTYGGMEVPGGIILSYVKPKYWIASICFAWGIVMMSSGFVQNYAGALVARIFLGITEASFFPSALVLVGNWYPRLQFQTRITAFYVIGVFSGAFSGLLAYGIHYMDGVGGLASWRWIFILEGIATVVLSSLILIFLPNDPESSNWLTRSEKDAILANNSAEGNDGHAHFEWRYLKEVVTDYKVWMCTWLSSSVNIVTFGFSYNLPSILVQMGYKAEIAQLMTVPVYASACLFTLVSGIYSDRRQVRSHMIVVGFTGALLGLVLLYVFPKDRNPGARYAGCMILMSGIYMSFPGTVAWTSNNAESKGKRNIAMAFQLTIASLATTVGTNSYLAREAPHYPTGFGLSMAMCASSILVAISLNLLIRRANRKLDEKERETLAADMPIDEADLVKLRFRYIT